jgi:dihydrofolate reductase
MRLALHTFLTLDGVMQAPGGWSFPYGDEEFANPMISWFEHADAFLLGRKTYDIFNSYWPQHDDPADPIASRLNRLPKHVASRTRSSFEWENTSQVSDVVSEVTKLKEQPGDELQVHGSGALAHTLIDHDLIDEYRLMIFPVHLGSGKKLFADGAKAASLRLLSSRATSSGIVIATYEPAGDVRYGSY